jgi:hypothetical protein
MHDITSGISGGYASEDIPFGEVMRAATDPYPQDADVLSFNGVVGLGQSYVHRGLDLVCARHGPCVLFLVTGSEDIPNSHGNFLTPQAGFSLVTSVVSSPIIRSRPTVDGIIQAYRGYSKQEGYTGGPYTHNSSSSSDLNGEPNFQTLSEGAGGSFGIPEILGEYHIYTTYAEPIWPR